MAFLRPKLLGAMSFRFGRVLIGRSIGILSALDGVKVRTSRRCVMIYCRWCRMTKPEREYIGNDEVAYWQVINRRGEVEATFQHRLDADNLVIGSGCSYLYTVQPVFLKDLMPYLRRRGVI